MCDGKFQNGEKVLCVKIDMVFLNINLWDFILYWICYVDYYQIGNKWCIYLMYDFIYLIFDVMENIIYFLCILEFEDYCLLYDWVLENIFGFCYLWQIEFVWLNLNYIIISKCKFKCLVDENFVDGWNDLCMFIIFGMWCCGYILELIWIFCDMIGVNKVGGIVDVGMFEYVIWEDLNIWVFCVMCVMWLFKVILINYLVDKIEMLVLLVYFQNLDMGEWEVIWSQILFIDCEDFVEELLCKWK